MLKFVQNSTGIVYVYQIQQHGELLFGKLIQADIWQFHITSFCHFLSVEDIEQISEKIRELNRPTSLPPSSLLTKTCTCIRIGIGEDGRAHYWPWWVEDEDYGDEELSAVEALRLMSHSSRSIEVAWLNPIDGANWELQSHPFKG